MPLTIHCSMCGANITADEPEVRRGVVTCSHCSTVQRIAAEGTRKAFGEAGFAKALEGIQVDREGPGNLTVVARHTRDSVVVNKAELDRRKKIGLSIRVGITLLSALISSPFLFFYSERMPSPFSDWDG
jgi:hypothetical protein